MYIKPRVTEAWERALKDTLIPQGGFLDSKSIESNGDTIIQLDLSDGIVYHISRTDM